MNEKIYLENAGVRKLCEELLQGGFHLSTPDNDFNTDIEKFLAPLKSGDFLFMYMGKDYYVK